VVRLHYVLVYCYFQRSYSQFYILSCLGAAQFLRSSIVYVALIVICLSAPDIFENMKQQIATNAMFGVKLYEYL
jgi:hypothetical protein